MVGAGLGVWMKSEEQAGLMLQVYADAIQRLDLQVETIRPMHHYVPPCTPCIIMRHVVFVGHFGILFDLSISVHQSVHQSVLQTTKYIVYDMIRVFRHVVLRINTIHGHVYSGYV